MYKRLKYFRFFFNLIFCINKFTLINCIIVLINFQKFGDIEQLSIDLSFFHLCKNKRSDKTFMMLLDLKKSVIYFILNILS